MTGIREGMTLLTPKKDQYVRRPDDAEEVLIDYNALARAIAAAGGIDPWQLTCRFPPAEKFPTELPPFERVEVVLTDVCHHLAVVDAGMLFTRYSPGHLFYCELARIVYMGYTGVCNMYVKGEFARLAQLNEEIMPYFRASRAPSDVYTIPDLLIGVFRWMPNNTCWLKSHPEGSHNADIFTFGLLYTVHQVLASMTGTPKATPTLKQMKCPIAFSPALALKFGEFRKCMDMKHMRALEFTPKIEMGEGNSKIHPAYKPEPTPNTKICVTMLSNVMPYLSSVVDYKVCQTFGLETDNNMSLEEALSLFRSDNPPDEVEFGVLWKGLCSRIADEMGYNDGAWAMPTAETDVMMWEAGTKMKPFFSILCGSGG